jgi:hypothetical protein
MAATSILPFAGEQKVTAKTNADKKASARGQSPLVTQSKLKP